MMKLLLALALFVVPAEARNTPTHTVQFSHSATPATPASGTVKFYFKSDGKAYKLLSTGVESEVGAAASGGSTLAATTKTANYTVTNADDVILCNSASGVTITMTLQASASATRKLYFFKNIGAGDCILDANSSETIDRDTTLLLSPGGAPQMSVQLYPDGGTAWYAF